MRKLKFLFLFLVCLFFNFGFVSALERTEDNNWGVNKRWNITDKNLHKVKKTRYVDSKLKVYDYANILTDAEEKEIYNDIISFIEKYNIDMVFLTDSFSYSKDIQNDDFAHDFYDYNDFGMNYDHYDGVIIFRNANPSDPYYIVRFFGDAQLYYNQARLDVLLDDIYSLFHSDKYVLGMKKAISIISSDIDRGIPESNNIKYVDNMGILRSYYRVPIIACLIGSSIITLITMIILIAKNRMVRKATTASEYLSKDSINYSKHVDQFTHSHTTHHTISSSSGGGGGSHIGSSGGGSFGGGRHG